MNRRVRFRLTRQQRDQMIREFLAERDARPTPTAPKLQPRFALGDSVRAVDHEGRQVQGNIASVGVWPRVIAYALEGSSVLYLESNLRPA